MGAAGYIAPRHLKAIHDLGHSLVAAMDKHDSVGVLDNYFPECRFFTEFERFERFLAKENRVGQNIDYLSICTPNYLHDAHCRFGLRMGMDVICEKPIVLTPWNLEALIEAENTSGKRIANILQLRYHPSIQELKKKIEKESRTYNVKLNYVSPRGNWYQQSWKGDVSKSGGIITNIGIHLFDVLIWLFGDLTSVNSIETYQKMIKGSITLESAKVDWLLSTRFEDLPEGKSSVRSLLIDGEAVELDNQFDDLHTICYDRILNGEVIPCTSLRQLLQLLWTLRRKAENSTH